MLGNGKSAQQVIDAFVAQYGQAALMAPPKRGFNLLGYFVPMFVILVAGTVLVLVLLNWTRKAKVAAPASSATSNASPEELARLQRELDRLPG